MNENKVRKFHEVMGTYKLYLTTNDAETNQIGKTHKNGSKTIVLIVAISGIIEYAEGCKLLRCNEVVK